MFKSLLIAYLVTGAFLALLAFVLYRFSLQANVVSIAITVIYVLVTVLGGFIMGKFVRSRKFFWGFVIGIVYFALMLIVSLVVYRGLDNFSVLTTMLVCAGGGTLGGMLA